MKHPARRSGSPNFSFALLALALAVVASRSATAQVIEPNGISVPATVPASTETTLQQFFTMKGETINAVANASITPATFLRSVQLSSDAGAQPVAGAWPASPGTTCRPARRPPPPFYTIGTPPLALGQTIASADIRNDANYLGGLIGFALLKYNGDRIRPRLLLGRHAQRRLHRLHDAGLLEDGALVPVDADFELVLHGVGGLGRGERDLLARRRRLQRQGLPVLRRHLRRRRRALRHGPCSASAPTASPSAW